MAKAAAAAAAAESAAADAPPAGVVDTEYEVSNIKEHAKTKGMWAGALTPCQIADLFGAAEVGSAEPAGASELKRTVIAEIVNPHTPALLKAFDEVITNASDHAMGQRRASAADRVLCIEIDFDPATGVVTVYNDGPGIPVRLHEGLTAQRGRDVYMPEVLFSEFLAGSNLTKSTANIKGGINGLGAKIANVHSVRFELDTTGRDALGAYAHYSQVWHDRIDDARTERARIEPAGAASEAWQRTPHTRVRFLPAYAALGYAAGPGGAPITAAAAADLDAWLRLRAHQVAAYVGAATSVRYRGAELPTRSAAALARLLTAEPDGGEPASPLAATLVLSGAAKAAEEPWKFHPWDIALIVLPPGKRVARRVAARDMTIINGVVSNRGSHITWLRRKLSEAVETKLRAATKNRKGAGEKAMTAAETLSSVRIVLCGALPGADWKGQSKDELQVAAATLDHYALTKTFLAEVGARVSERLLMGSAAAAKVVHDKYERAGAAGGAQRASARLLAAEGDSAITFLKSGITAARGSTVPGGPNKQYCGWISLGGVVMNAEREVNAVDTADGSSILVRSAKLTENKRLCALADALGLDYGKTYETAAERATLKYGSLVLCVDQDLDGTGKIAPLVLVWIHLFWPALIRHGFVGRFLTPLVRAYPARGRGDPVEFFYEDELRRWLAEDPERARAHRIKYYKGLATHSTAEVRRMFQPALFAASIYTYTADDDMAKYFHIYFGGEPALRREVLVRPVDYLSAERAAALRARREIPVGEVQLNIDARAYKGDAIHRQIPSAVCGLNPARSKILAGALQRFASLRAEVKVFQLGGFVADKLAYHHGDKSLNDTIISMAAAHLGGRRYPLLAGVGQFGNRHGDEAGSPRYISVRLGRLARALFPAEDRWFLDYTFVDGVRAEPHYAPVVPLAVLESASNPSEGWTHRSFARALGPVLNLVRGYIAGDPALLAAADDAVRVGHGGEPGAIDYGRLALRWPLPPETAGYTGGVRAYRGEVYSFGSYTYDAARGVVRITDLPIGVETSKYIATLTAEGRSGAANPRAELIERVDNNSSDQQIDLLVWLRPGAGDRICAGYGTAEIDPFEDALALRASLRPQLNWYSTEGGVLEFGTSEAPALGANRPAGYIATVLYWAPHRRRIYGERARRAHTVALLKLAELENRGRYVAESAALGITEIEDESVAAQILAERGFLRLDTGLLHSPQYTPNDDLERLVREGPGANYDYLLNMREREFLKSAAERNRAAVEKARTALAEAELVMAEKPFPGAAAWRADLAAAEAELRRCVPGRGYADEDDADTEAETDIE